jgi:DNA invertase Pin-like site-specific DNA recombinase
MTKVALCARYASGLQNGNDDPIKDQRRICHEYAARQNWDVVGTYDDPGRSGVDFQRPGLHALLEDARRGRFDIVLAEALDRPESRSGRSRQPVQATRLRRGAHRHTG